VKYITAVIGEGQPILSGASLISSGVAMISSAVLVPPQQPPA